MPGTTEAITFTDSYKHMECLGGMRLQSFLTNGYFVYPCKKKPTVFTRATPGTPASIYKTVGFSFECVSMIPK